LNTTTPAALTGLPVTSQAPARQSSAVTSRVDDVAAAPHRQKVPSYYDDVNMPSDSYFTGDEEIPVWNVPDHVPLLDAATATDDDDDDDNSNKLMTLSQLLLRFLPYINSSDTGALDSGGNRDVIPDHKPVTSSVPAGYYDDDQPTDSWSASFESTTIMTTPFDGHIPLVTTTQSPQSSRIISRLFPTTSTTPRQLTSQKTHFASPHHQSHVHEYEHDVTAMTSVAPRRDADNHTSPSYVPSSPHSHQQNMPPAAAPNPARTGRVGGFGSPAAVPRVGSNYFDFFDYVVEYQTVRPPRRRLRVKARRQRKKMNSWRRVRPGDRMYTGPVERRSGGVEQVDVVGESHGVEITDAADTFDDSGDAESFDLLGGRRGGSQQRRGRLPQSASAWTVGQRARRSRHDSVEIRGRSAVHLAATVNRNHLQRGTSGRRFLKD